jgi:hypothetical protein
VPMQFAIAWWTKAPSIAASIVKMRSRRACWRSAAVVNIPHVKVLEPLRFDNLIQFPSPTVLRLTLPQF